jgi:hypothetical protein
VEDSFLTTTGVAGDVIISATDTSKIDATVAAVAAAVAGGGTGVGVAIGAAYASNMIGYDLLLGIIPIKDAAQVRAYVDNSDITATGDVKLTATAKETITSRIISGSVAIAAGGTGVGVGGSGVVAINLLATDISSYISSTSQVTGKSVILTADDTSRIMAYGGAAAITGGFGGTGVAVSIGVALAHNMIDNNVAAYISGSTVTSTGGNIEVHAVEHSLINSVSAAAALAVGIGGVGVSVAGAGAEASNVVLTRTNAYIENSGIISADDVDVTAESLPATLPLDNLEKASKAEGDTLAGQLDDASSTDADKDDGDPNERDDDILADQNFFSNELSNLLSGIGIINSGELAITLRDEGKQWSVTDRDTGYSYTITRIDDTKFSVSRSTIGAAVISAAAAVAGGSVGVGVSIGVSFATNLIGWKVGLDDSIYNPDYTTGDSPDKLVQGDRVKIEDGVREGYIYEYIGPSTDIYDYTTAEVAPTLREGDLVMVNEGFDDSRGAESSIYRYIGNDRINVNLNNELYDDFNDGTDELWESVGSSKLSMQDYGNKDLWKQVNLEESPAEVQAYVLNSNVYAEGGLNQTAFSDQSIDALVVAGSAAASGGGVGVSVAGAGAGAVNIITTYVKAFIEGDGTGAKSISAGSVTVRAEDTSRISAVTGAASLAAAFGGVGVAVSIGVAGAYNMISNDVAAYIYNAGDVAGGVVGVTTTGGDITVQAIEAATINSLTAAASLAVTIGGVGVSVSGAGAAASNVILTTTEAYVLDSNLDSDGGVTISASDTSTINAVVLASTAAIAGGGVGVGVSIGASFAGNFVGSELNYAGAKSYVRNSTITADGAFVQTATAAETIRSAVIAASVAIAPGGVGVGVSGTGVLAINMITADIKAYVDNSTITAGSVSVTADDTSQIMAFAGSASVAAAFGGVGVAVSIGVALAHNMISNDVAAFITDSDVESKIGNIAVYAVERSLINSVTAAASLAVAIGGVGVSVSGAGAEASNVILTKTNAYIEHSEITSKNNVDVTAESLSAAPGLSDLTMASQAEADTLADNLDDASSTDADKDDGGANERDEDIIADQDFLSNTLSTLLSDNGIVNSGELAVTLRSEGKQWSVTDRVTGYSYTVTRVDDTKFTVSMSSIGATVIAASAAVAGGGVGVGVSIGVSFATNLIGWKLGDTTSSNYTTGQTIKHLERDDSGSDPNVTRVKIEEGVREGYVYEYVGEDVDLYDYHTGEGTKTLSEGDLVMVEAGYGEGNPAARGTGGSIYRYTGSGGSVNLGQQDYIGYDFLSSAGTRTVNNGVQVKLAEGSGTGESGAVYEYTGSNGTELDLSNQNYNTGGWIKIVADVPWESVGSSKLSMQDYGNKDLWKQVNLEESPAEVQAYVLNSSVDADGGLNQTAVSDQSIDSLVVAGSAAASGAGVGVSVSGAGAGAVNIITTDVKAYIEGDGTDNHLISAGSVKIRAQDTSRISAVTGAASLAAAFGGVGVAV